MSYTSVLTVPLVSFLHHLGTSLEHMDHLTERALLLPIQVDICCFDKTGTLTSDNMVLEGLTGLPGKGQELLADVKQAGKEVVRVLAACQALIQVDGKFVGDPLEKASFTAVGEVPDLCDDAPLQCIR